MHTRHRQLFIISAVLLTGFGISCKKTEKEIIYLQGARSSFTTTVFLPSINNRVEGTAHVVDSAFYFNNLSDTGATVSYHWDFGDGNVSTEKEPVHRYAAVGAYTVTLETRVQDIPSDTSTVMLRVIKGQSLISLDEKTDTRGIDMIQTDDGGFLLLGSSQIRDPASPTVNYFLMKLNQQHEQVSLLPLPNGQQYVSLTAGKDGKFLLTSRAGDNNPVNLTLTVSLTDTRISSVPYDDIDIKSVTATSDGGFLFTSSRNAYTPQNQFLPHTYLLKTDGNGSIQWTRFFTGSDALYNGSTVYEDGDGYVLAGSDEFNHTSSFTCPSCQTLSLISVNQSGTPVWRRRTSWASIYGGGTAWVSRLPDSRFIVGTRQNRSLYYFSAQTGLDDRKLLPLPSEGIAVSTSGSVVSIGQEIGSNLQAAVMGVDRSGQLSWQKKLPDLQLISKNYSCCFVSIPVKIISLRDGGTLLLATRYDNEYSDRFQISKVVLLELDDQGNPM